MARKKGIVPVGQGRISKSLGASDPRNYRNAQAAQASHLNLGTGVERDARGRLRITAAKRVEKIDPNGATTDDAVAAFNRLVDELRESGALDDGRK
jgi:L-asparaginase/Glu-tRNA(Gln) amidotransferase subunit D